MVPPDTLHAQPLRIFLSSTAQDLGDYRQAVADVIERLGHAPSRMETFGAKTTQSLDECQQLAQAADALVVIVAHRYGWIPQPKDGGDGKKSVTWHEVEAATAAAVPVFRYLREPTAAAADDDERLEEFRGFLRQFPCDTFSDPDDLATKVSITLGDWSRYRARDFKAALRMLELPKSGAQVDVFKTATLFQLPLISKATYLSDSSPAELAQLVDGTQVNAAKNALARQQQQYDGEELDLKKKLAAAEAKAQGFQYKINSLEAETPPTAPAAPYDNRPSYNQGQDIDSAVRQAAHQAYINARNNYEQALKKHTELLAAYEERKKTIPEQQKLLMTAQQHVSQLNSDLSRLAARWTDMQQQLEAKVLIARDQDIASLLQLMRDKGAQLISDLSTLTQGFLLLLATDFACYYVSKYLWGHAPAVILLEQVKKDIAELVEETVRLQHQRIDQDCLSLLSPLTDSVAYETKLLSQIRVILSALPEEEVSRFCLKAKKLLAPEIPSAQVDYSLISPDAIAEAHADITQQKKELEDSIRQNNTLYQKNIPLQDQVLRAKQSIKSVLNELKAHAALGKENLANGKLAWDIIAKAAQTRDFETDTKAFCACLQFEGGRRLKEPVQALIARYEWKDFGVPEAQKLMADEFPAAFLKQMKALQARIPMLESQVPEFAKALDELTELPRQQAQVFKRRFYPIVFLAIFPIVNLVYTLFVSDLLQKYKPAFASTHPAYSGLRAWVLPRLTWAIGLAVAGAAGSALAIPIIEDRVYWASPALLIALFTFSYGVSLFILLFMRKTVQEIDS